MKNMKAIPITSEPRRETEPALWRRTRDDVEGGPDYTKMNLRDLTNAHALSYAIHARKANAAHARIAEAILREMDRRDALIKGLQSPAHDALDGSA